MKFTMTNVTMAMHSIPPLSFN